ncbi:threonine/serine exporter family protein [Alkalihalobacillus sp. LMS39]|uniref:threonine/serine exporter family protein n=1 Tax=Alkalihalobacillus sp. LMS39 TaxID=2924032 RepID=UPI001FB33EFD|nr:threonine/serine exporter family protein [Alkalihalobacillus sp. LMS39]UOE94204.1 threonine/serine exporter family protein [Alkalihalobacillus sp. LMS39]
MTKADRIMDICLLAGETMLIYGAETYRVEETIERMAKAGGVTNVHSFVTTTGIFLSFDDEGKGDMMQMVRVDDRIYDLNKVSLVNQVSREYVSSEIDEQKAYEKLLEIAKAPMNYPPWLIHIASGMAGAGFSYLFGGGIRDMLPAFIAGFIVSLALFTFQDYLKVKFFAEFIAAFIGGATAIFLVYIGLGINLDQIIIGTLMPLVPGVPLTNAVRDLMSGDYVAGVSRGAEAMLTALSIATGIALAIGLFLA